MMNRGAIKQYVSEMLGMINPDGMYFLDNTTTPTNTRMNMIYDESIRWITSLYGFRFTETQCSYPFFHSIDTQGLFLSGTSSTGVAMSGTITPYPDNILAIGCSTPLPYLESVNYSGITFSGITIVGASGVTGVSASGSLVNSTYNGVGYPYDLGNGVDKIIAVTVPHIALKLQYMTQYDVDRYVPLGITSASGTPIWYVEMNGMSPSGNKSIQFYPFPQIPEFIDKRFTLHFMKEHKNTTSDSETQNIIPQQFEYIIADKMLEMVYAMISEPTNAAMYAKKVSDRGLQMRSWAERNYDAPRRWTDGDVQGSYMPNTNVNVGTAGMLNLI